MFTNPETDALLNLKGAANRLKQFFISLTNDFQKGVNEHLLEERILYST